MTAAQEAMMKKTQGAREVVGVGVMKAPEAAVPEDAQTAGEGKQGRAAAPEEALAASSFPLNDKHTSASSAPTTRRA
jgi:hypothetical protein